MKNPAFNLVCAALLCAGCGGGNGSVAAGPAATDSTTVSVADVQGPGAASPVVGQTVSVEGIVSGDFQDGDADTSANLGGFFLQSRAADNNPATSEGIFVFDGAVTGTDVAVGDIVTVSGEVQEHFGETQIAATSVSVSGSAAAVPVDLTLPAAGVSSNSDGDPIAGLERFEGMLVRLPQTLAISELRNLERFGELLLSQGGRLYQFTNQSTPGAAAYRAHREANAVRSIVLDDGLRAADVTPIRYLDAGTPPGTALRVGDTVAGITGNLRYSRGSGGTGAETWRVMPTADPVFAAANPRPGAPAVGGSLRVASFNVLNYFSTIDNGQNSCGPAGTENCRGADSVVEQRRQLDKITTALVMTGADIIGLMEVENNAEQSLRDIVDALNARLGAGSYAALDTGTIGDDTIKTGFIYRPGNAIPRGGFAILDANVDARFNDDRNRPALAQTFEQVANGALLTVAVNHLKSKGSDCTAEGDPNTGDGQGNCNRTRERAAAALADWLATDPTASGDPDFLIIGDLNAYLQEDPLQALRAAGYVNLIERAVGPQAYSFVFDGQSGALDHALASPSLAAQVADAVEWHINADEARARDYNLEHGRDPGIFDAATPYRASDHDPVIVGINLN